jgi:hypothetical protein
MAKDDDDYYVIEFKDGELIQPDESELVKIFNRSVFTRGLRIRSIGGGEWPVVAPFGKTGKGKGKGAEVKRMAKR